MSTANRKAITMVRLVAAGFLIVGVMNLALYWFQINHAKAEFSVVSVVMKCVPLVIGIWILIKASTLAEKVDEYLDGE